MGGLNLQVEALRKQLEGAELEGGEFSQGQSGERVEQLVRDIEKLRQADGEPDLSNSGVYQLYLNSGRGDAASSVSVASLDQRLSQLEQCLASSQGQSGRQRVLSSNTDGLSLAEAVGVLGDSRQFLSRSHISHMEGRLASLAFKVGSISEQKESLAQARHQDK